ncbi:MAG: outer membrane lipoprotein-sorting protein [Desulfomonile tiedjei]|nr:outer membrane lipoprotein-sorting protein [Desulfomonile tiedjei]
MFRTYKRFTLALLGLVLWCVPADLCALTAQEILDQGAKQNLGDSFRIALSVKTFKAKKLLSDQVLWLMARIDQGAAHIFVDFDAPPESKGMRFLLLVKDGQDPKALMYLPATGRTVPLAVDEPSADIGGTGLTMEDIQGFMPKGGDAPEIVREEALDGRDCYVIRVKLPNGAGERLLWVSKNDLLVVKSQQVDSAGTVKRIFRVVEFFKTDQGKEFPREEEILIPDKNIRIQLRQDSAVFGIEIPEGVMDPEKFGTFNWRG